MKLPIYQVDAFTSQVFSGNPAAVCILESWLDDEQQLAIAAENNLSETAFVIPGENANSFQIRWFTPLTEVALCGHATLASGLVLFECQGVPGNRITFQTRRSGQLMVSKNGGCYELDFPARRTRACPPPEGLLGSLGLTGAGVFAAGEDVMVVVKSEVDVLRTTPDSGLLKKVDCRGVIVTAPGTSCDFVSRFFAPRVGVDEDPVTGSAHCALIPYWSSILGKPKLYARQVSKRGGELFCEYHGERVTIAGRGVLYMTGEINF